MPTEAALNPPSSADVPHHAVQDQLKRVLGSPLFMHSRRYPAFLRYVVDEVLKGNKELLKERTIGIQVFGRSPGYDLNTDPVVRVTAGEVRKRLAQYYYEAEHRDELRIEMHPGSYIPEFKFASTHDLSSNVIRAGQAAPTSLARAELTPIVTPPPTPATVGLAELPAAEPLAPPLPPAPAKRFPRRWLAACGTLLLLAVATGLYLSGPHSALDRFWVPALQGRSPILIAVGSWDNPAATARDLSIGVHAKSSAPVALADTVAIVNLQQLLAAHGKQSLIQTSGQTSFSDLQRGSTILISAYDNDWTMRLTDPLRFHFVYRSPSLLAIEDRKDPRRVDWQIDTNTPYVNLTRDFGIIARFHDPTTKQVIVVVAGIGENGTIAASEMLTADHLLEDALRQFGLDAGDRNIEGVVETQVIDGKSGPPNIVALTVW